MRHISIHKVKYLIDNVWYSLNGYFGCQLESEEFFRPYPTNRVILDRKFDVYSADKFFKFGIIPFWRITWRMRELDKDDLTFEEKRGIIEKLYQEFR